MFYSETLLSKTGPLARVWLSANLERKLSKTHILQSDIESSVDAIVNDRTAPMALRLSGQLLLGVVRIYSRKARYLLDDCNEALLKIKMAFRTGNVDLPTTANNHHARAFTIEDQICDLAIPDMDPSLLDFEISSNPPLDAMKNPLHWYSQNSMEESSIEIARHATPVIDRPDFDEEDMHIDLDLGLDLPALDQHTEKAKIDDSGNETIIQETSILQVGDDMNTGESGALAFPSPSLPLADLDVSGAHATADTDMQPTDDFRMSPTLQASEKNELPVSPIGLASRQKSLSKEVHSRGAPLAKKKRSVRPDGETMISSCQIKQQQADRSAILKPATTVTNMNHNSYVQQLMEHGGLPSEFSSALQTLMSMEKIKVKDERKRKRDSGVFDVSEEDSSTEHEILLNIPADETFDMIHEDAAPYILDANANPANVKPGVDSSMIAAETEIENNSIQADNTEDTVHIPFPIGKQISESRDANQAIKLLKDHLEYEMLHLHEKRACITFDYLMPTNKASRVDATTTFFEVLVLATKNQVRVEQENSNLYCPIRIQAKQAL